MIVEFERRVVQGPYQVFTARNGSQVRLPLADDEELGKPDYLFVTFATEEPKAAAPKKGSKEE